MGAKSSFAVASLTHHAFIHFCFSMIPDPKIRVSDAYVLVGDDLVIFDEELALIVKDKYPELGVTVQEPKSKVPVGADLFTEFCSRTSINNIEVSRVPPSLIKNASSN